MKLKRSIYLTLITLFLILAYNVYSETAKMSSSFDIQNGEINITSISFELDMKNSVLSFNGDVSGDVSSEMIDMEEDYIITCQKLEVYFKRTPDDTSNKDNKYNVIKIVATGSVEITRSDGANAKAEHVVYNKDLEKIVMTGNPDLNYLKDDRRYQIGGDGKIVTYYTKEKRFHVKGTKENKANIKIKSGEDER